MSRLSKPLRWAIGLAVVVVVGAACVAEIQVPWLSLVVDGNELGSGQLASYCWSSIAALCADGDRSDPPTFVVRSSRPVNVQVRTKAGLRELEVGVTAINPRDVVQGAYTPSVPVDPAHAAPLALAAGTHYISVLARWDRGNAHFLFALRVEPP
jgi:hypothetical protein